jgi:hypothetical protein
MAIAKRFRGVVDFEDAKFPEIKKAQHRSTSCPHLMETDALKTGGVRGRPRSALGTVGLVICPHRPEGNEASGGDPKTLSVAAARRDCTPLTVSVLEHRPGCR